MKYIIVGLGNLDEKYKKTRHNAGRIVLNKVREVHGFPNWRRDGKLNALVSEGMMGGAEVMLLLPETYMNNSGVSVRLLIKNADEAKHLIVVHDDLDLPLGSFKISFDRGAGGHNGVASIIKEIGTKAFIRIRIGISPASFLGKLMKPRNESFVLKMFTSSEAKKINALVPRIDEALQRIVEEGVHNAMNHHNQ